MTRFFITPKQAAKQVLSSIEIMHGGEIFVPKLKSAKIIDLARQAAPGCKIKIIGAQKEEKIHEDLITKQELQKTYELADRYIILAHGEPSDAKTLSDDFSFSSDDAKLAFSKDELIKIIDESKAFADFN